MKNLRLLVIAILLFGTTLNINAQGVDSVYIISNTDEMSGKTYIFANKGVLVTNDTKTIGFKLSPHISDNLTLGMITAKIVGLGSCHEADEIILLFEDGQKIITKSHQTLSQYDRRKQGYKKRGHVPPLLYHSSASRWK
jgi:hypothetical protein